MRYQDIERDALRRLRQRQRQWAREDAQKRKKSPSPRAQRMYAAAKSSRLTAGWTPSNSSADSELVTSLTTLRSRSRSLVRDAGYAKRAKVLVVNNVIGNGIGLQAQVKTNAGKLNARVNGDIEAAWKEWTKAESCHTGGRLAFMNLERALMAQVFEAGEVFVRKHYRPFGRSRVPFALELIEGERLADEFTSAHLTPVNGNQVRMGVEVDQFYRPVAYFIRERHPSEFRFGHGQIDRIERVPADQIIHLAVVDRWPQTRGEPWMHTAIRTMDNVHGYTEAEIIRARTQAGNVGAIETPEDTDGFGERQDDGSVEMEVEPGVYKRLNPGEKLHPTTLNSPNPALDGFMRYMLREIAAGTGPSYESLSRDYSQSNYSSSRLATLDDRDLWRFYQAWFICDLRQEVHSEWLRQAVFARTVESIQVEQYALDPTKFEAVRYKPRGWSWVDPTKEVQAFKEAVTCGFTTVTDVIAATAGGADIEDVIDGRARELELMREKSLVFETSPEFYDQEEAMIASSESTDDDVQQTEDVQQTALNGAQIASLLEVLTQVTDKQLSPETAKAMLAAAFPALSSDLINEMVDNAAAFEPARPPPTGEEDDDPGEPAPRRVLSFRESVK